MGIRNTVNTTVLLFTSLTYMNLIHKLMVILLTPTNPKIKPEVYDDKKYQ